MGKKLTLLLFLLLSIAPAVSSHPPKREFRGAWIQAVNGQFIGMSPTAMQQTLLAQLDTLQAAGINAILFQVRPEADALYASPYEPWSRFLTGEQGKAPAPYWDPLQFMVDACHARGMELHAWINPYRAKTKGTHHLDPSHLAVKHPERFFAYDDLLLFDPGLKENIDYICTIAADIVSRYDIDGLHIDDYFYPYPANNAPIPDAATFARYGKKFSDVGDWRRDNVNRLVRALSRTIHRCKPWVTFSVSPFGIYRNITSDPRGSNTNGLQNYDQLYADVLLWIRKGWIDYNIPQLYWQIGHPAADYDTLIRWWSDNAKGCPLIIGQDVERTVQYADPNDPNRNQQSAKMQLQRQLADGSCQWYAAAVVANPGNYRDALAKDYHRYPALIPQAAQSSKKTPGKVKKLCVADTSDGPVLFWTAPRGKKPTAAPYQYVVYRFPRGERPNLDDPTKILTITQDTHLCLSSVTYSEGDTFVVTALNRLHAESQPATLTLK